jgi:peptidoglycan/xylan/chitin deacetylase (PgdA/CDA1 family)
MATGALRRLRMRAAPAAKTALLRLGGYATVRRLAPSTDIAILRYHAVCGDEGAAYADPFISVSPAAFEQHIQYLAARYAVLSLDEIVERLRTQRALPHNTVAITFDDGYADNLAAARTMNRYGVSATFFIAAGCLAGGDPFWPAEIRALVGALREPVLTLDVAGRDVTIPVHDASAREAAIRRLTKLFKSNTIATRESMRDQLRRAAGHPRIPECMLTWAQLAEMKQLGMTIGAHTLTHPNLPSAGVEAATREIVGSKQRLEDELGVPVTLFSYPNGGADRYYTPELQRVVAGAGFAAAASSRNAFARRDSDLYALERIEVEERLEDLVFALEVERFAFKPQPRTSELVADRP